MGRFLVGTRFFVKPAARCDIDLATENRFEVFGQHGIVEIDHAVHRAMVGDRTSLHAQFSQTTRQVTQTDGSVQQAVFSVQVQVRKGRYRHDSSKWAARLCPAVRFPVAVFYRMARI